MISTDVPSHMPIIHKCHSLSEILKYLINDYQQATATEWNDWNALAFNITQLMQRIIISMALKTTLIQHLGYFCFLILVH